MWLVFITALTEAGGYASLVWLINHSGETNIYGSYVAMQVLVVLSPNLLQAANYSTVGQVVRVKGLHNKRKFLKPRFISTFFIIADVLALIVQAIGISLWASSKGSGSPNQSQISLGSWITVIGLAIQLFSFAVFGVLAVWVHKQDYQQNFEWKNKKRWHRRLFIGIYATICLITLRNVYRFVEFIQGAILTWYGKNNIIVAFEAFLICTNIVKIVNTLLDTTNTMLLPLFCFILQAI